MGMEDSSQCSRRATRSLVSAIASDNLLEDSRKGICYEPTIADLVYGGEKSLTFDDLISSFPGRTSEIKEIIWHLGPLNSPMLPLFIYGGASTGKTSIILEIFRYLKRPFVYSSCLNCYNPKMLFASILNQLCFHRRDESNGYMNVKKCEKPSNFANFLREALVSVLGILKGRSAELNSKKKSCDDWGNMIYLIFDDFELVRAWDKSSIIVPFLFGLYRMLGLPEVGIIFISKESLCAYYSNSGFIEPVPLYFPGYTEDDRLQNIMKKQEKSEFYSCFLEVVPNSFFRVTRQVDELSIAFRPLYEKYCEFLKSQGSNFSWERKDAKARLYGHLAPHIRTSLNEMLNISSPSVEVKDEKVKGKASGRILGGQDEELDFHMSISAKYLLISAFLASRNPATLDASLFDSTGSLDNRKKRRKCSEKTMVQKEIAEQEFLLKGPGTFPLERLLAIFQCITCVADISDDNVLDDDDKSLQNPLTLNSLTSNVLLQVSSLCNANFISKGGSYPLEGSNRYKSTISEDLALKVAKSLNFPLSRYLYRR